MPTLVVTGHAFPVLHVSQIASALGLPPAPSGDPQRDGADAAVILEAWLGHIHELEWETLLRPTPSRGRSLRNLTVNVRSSTTYCWVGVQTSELASKGNEAASGAGGGGDCRTRDFIAQFSLVVAFDAAPVPAAEGEEAVAVAETSASSESSEESSEEGAEG